MSGSLLVNLARPRSAVAGDTPMPPGPRPVLLCFPPAGAGCGQFRSWQRSAGDTAVIGVQLPGREERWREPPAESVDAIIDAVVAPFVCGPPRPLVIYGNSFGGLLAYEAARRLGREHGRWPQALVIAACRSPRRWVGAGRERFNEDSELEQLLAEGSLAADELDDDTREMIFDVLRADARLSMTFALDTEPVLDCAIHVWGGDTDTFATPAQLDEWCEFGVAGAHRETFAGGHLFATAYRDEIVARLVDLTGDATQRKEL